MVKRKGTVDKVTLIRNIYTDLDECELTIGFDTYKAFYPYSDLEGFQGKEVSFVSRPDVVNGLYVLVITEITLLSVVNTVESVNNVKLCPLNDARGVCNFDSSSAQVGNHYPGAIVMVTEYSYGSSKRAKWVDLTCIDMKSKVMYLRIFDATIDAQEAERTCAPLVGKYIKTDIQYTTYGFQTKEVNKLDIPTSISPSVALAKAIVEEEIKKYPDVAELCDVLQYIPKLEVLISPEPGWSLVKIATLLNIINNVDNLITGADIDLMKKAAILSQLHMLPTKYKYDDDVKTIVLLKRSATLGTNNKIIALLSSKFVEDETDAVYKAIKRMADELNDIRYLYGG